ncbi:tRNA (adenosine(37)-N6)-dimethylallyltransferase MiaA, partial [Pedobacter sp. HMWF019]|uniref:tRNA (adenosine(37)-N6)-dimethylallyltransferase MiaA n=1 Tax=Pedobacter sp. HMWF019 TaxID=2056856 RepID=UPI000D3A870D
KTSLAIQLARHFKTEIVSADSRQFFKEMEIGTAKPSTEELAAAPHHFINSHSIQTFFSTGDFEIEAMKTINSLFKNHDQVVMVGGSGLYINAVCNGLDDLPETDLLVREHLNRVFAEQGLEEIKNQLREADPEYYAKVDQANPQRMIRGLEFFLSTGTKLSSHLTNSKKVRPFNILKIGLNMDRSLLYQQINHRVDLMMEAGLLEEVRLLVPYKDLNALNTVGYSELFRYLDAELTLQEAVEQIKQNTRRFAKRQLTWFRKDPDTQWFEPNAYPAILSYLLKNL